MIDSSAAIETIAAPKDNPPNAPHPGGRDELTDPSRRAPQPRRLAPRGAEPDHPQDDREEPDRNRRQPLDHVGSLARRGPALSTDGEQPREERTTWRHR